MQDIGKAVVIGATGVDANIIFVLVHAVMGPIAHSVHAQHE